MVAQKPVCILSINCSEHKRSIICHIAKLFLYIKTLIRYLKIQNLQTYILGYLFKKSSFSGQNFDPISWSKFCAKSREPQIFAYIYCLAPLIGNNNRENVLKLQLKNHLYLVGHVPVPPKNKLQNWENWHFCEKKV